MSCYEPAKLYIRQHVTSQHPNRCVGPTRFPSSVIDFIYDVIDVDDDWDRQIACVLAGRKKVSLTDYNPEVSRIQYSRRPKNLGLRAAAILCGVRRLIGRNGEEYYYRPEYERNAELLYQHFQGDERFPPGYERLIQSLLLGYTPEFFVLNELSLDPKLSRLIESVGPGTLLGPHLEQWQDYYEELLPRYIDYWMPRIQQAQEWIRRRGGA